MEADFNCSPETHLFYASNRRPWTPLRCIKKMSPVIPPLAQLARSFFLRRDRSIRISAASRTAKIGVFVQRGIESRVYHLSNSRTIHRCHLDTLNGLTVAAARNLRAGRPIRARINCALNFLDVHPDWTVTELSASIVSRGRMSRLYRDVAGISPSHLF